MHELSIAQSLIDAACEAAADEGSVRVTRLAVRIGLMSGVVPEALQFSFGLAAEGTACEGAVLEVEAVRVQVFCSQCDAPRTLPDGFVLSCPACGAPAPQIIAGRELELVSLEVTDDAAADS